MSDPTIVPAIFYKNPSAAREWLERAFGFETTMLIEAPDKDPSMTHIEMSFGDKGRIMIGGEFVDWARSPASLGGGITQSINVEVEADIDEHCRAAREAGAVIVQELADQPYGARTYRALDLEGHEWGFAQPVRPFSREELEHAGMNIRLETERAGDLTYFEAQPFYRDVDAALAWLEKAFGFETTAFIESSDAINERNIRAQMGHRGDQFAPASEWVDPNKLRQERKSPLAFGGANTQTLHIGLEADINGHYERARDAGAVVLGAPEDQFYGDRTYRAIDLEGHVWTFSMPVKEVSRAEAEAASGLTIAAKDWA